MLFSTKWLERYVDLPDSTEELAALLTRLGLVVEGERPTRGGTVFDLDIPSNRVDAMNHFGVARELAAGLRRELRAPEATLDEAPTPADTIASVTIDDLQSCPRYAARVIRGAKVAPSPAWMVELLEAIGLRPLNNVADITNFVLWELGHPLHAFDLDLLAENRIVVRRAGAGEKLTTLDAVDRELTRDDLVIADAEKPVALAGVMGGADSAISRSSTNILLEGAWFDPAAVRGTAQRLSLHTDASHRFQRSPAHDGMIAALDRAAALVVELAGGELASGIIDVVGTLPEPRSTALRLERIAGLLGAEVAGDNVGEILERLGFGVEKTREGFTVAIPSSRPDVAREEDLIEEVARHYGYDRLPATLPLISSFGESGTAEVLGERCLKACLAATGFCEAMSSSLSSPAEQEVFMATSQEVVELANPISENLGVLRAHLAPGLVAAAVHNTNRGQSNLRLFEVGRRFLGPVAEKGVTERWGVSLLQTGHRHGGGWDERPADVDLYDLKGAVDSVTAAMSWPAWDWQAGEHAGIAPSASAGLVARDESGSTVATGWAGKLTDAAAALFDIDIPVWIVELDVDALLPLSRPTPQYSAISKFPGGVRDLAIVLASDVEYARVNDTVNTAAAALPFTGLELLEVYQGEEIPAGHRGLTLRFSYRAADRTLTADEIDAAHQTIADALVAELGAQRR